MEDDKSINSDDTDFSLDDDLDDMHSYSVSNEEENITEATELNQSRYIPYLDLSNIEQNLDLDAPYAPRVPEPAGEWGITPPPMPAGVEGNITEDYLVHNIAMAGLNVPTNSHSS